MSQATSKRGPVKRVVGCLFLSLLLMAGAWACLRWWSVNYLQPAMHNSCANHLKQIGLGLKMYAGDHREIYPEKLVQARRYVADQSQLFVCPPVRNRPDPGTKPGPIETVDEWTDFVYVPGLLESVPPDTVLMYCHPSNHGGSGGNILFADGHVEWVNSEHSEYFVEGEPSFEDVIGTIGKQRKP